MCLVLRFGFVQACVCVCVCVCVCACMRWDLLEPLPTQDRSLGQPSAMSTSSTIIYMTASWSSKHLVPAPMSVRWWFSLKWAFAITAPSLRFYSFSSSLLKANQNPVAPASLTSMPFLFSLASSIPVSNILQGL